MPLPHMIVSRRHQVSSLRMAPVHWDALPRTLMKFWQEMPFQEETGFTPSWASPQVRKEAFFEQKVLSCNLLCPVIHLAAEALGNLDLYFLLNEEKIFEPHPILGNPDNDELHQGTRDVEFSLISPVQTFDGMYSTRLMEKACLQVQRKTSKEKIVLKPFRSIFAVHHAPY